MTTIDPVHSERREHESIDRQRLLYNLIPSMFYAVFEEGKLIEASDSCLAILEYRQEEAIGRPASDFLTAASNERLLTQHLPELAQVGRIREVACDFVTRRGETVPMLLTATAELDPSGKIKRILSVLTDANQRIHAERLLRTVLEATAALTGGDFFRSLVRHLAHAFQVMYVMVTECTDQRVTRLRTLACYKYEKFIERFEYDLAGGPCEGVIKNGACIYPRLRDLFPREDQYSYMGVAIYDSQGNVIGHLVIEDDKPMLLGPYDLDILRLFAARAGAELERKRAEEALEERKRELQELNERLLGSNRGLEQLVHERTLEIERRRHVAESLRDMVMILNSERPLHEILDYVVNAATQLLHADGGALFTLQEDKQSLVMQSTIGLPVGFGKDMLLPVDQSLLGLAILHRKPEVFTDLAASFNEQRNLLEVVKQTLLSEQFRSLLAVPLLRQNSGAQSEEIYGSIGLYYRTEHKFSDEEIDLAVAFGAQSALAIENANLRQRARIAAVIDERNRLARELHDSVTQQLYSITLLAEGWRRMANQGKFAGAEDAFDELGQLGQQALKEMRLLIYELRPPSLEKDGLLGALHQRLAAVEKRAGIESRLLSDDLSNLPPILEAELYRIILEALNNSLKHAAASQVTVQIQCQRQQIVLTIGDNGRGFDPARLTDHGGLGLTSMKERSRQLGGIFALHTAPNQGTTIEITLPL